MAALLEAGKCVLLPVNDDQRYDLVIDEERKFFRIQCKSARLIRGAVVFATCSRNLATGRRHYRGEVEFFGVYCPSFGDLLSGSRGRCAGPSMRLAGGALRQQPK
jgi:hypothetical protein